jgi:predicted RNA-binding protein with PIN domain
VRKTVYIVDGYNVLHRVPAFRDSLSAGPAAGRRALLAFCSDWMARRRDVWLFYVVFDGDSTVHPSREEGASPGVRVVYTATGETADRRVLSLAAERARDAHCIVVSDDGEVIRGAKADRVAAMSAAAFHAALRSDAGRSADGTDAKTDLPPLARKAIHDELLAAWCAAGQPAEGLRGGSAGASTGCKPDSSRPVRPVSDRQRGGSSRRGRE